MTDSYDRYWQGDKYDGKNLNSDVGRLWLRCERVALLRNCSGCAMSSLLVRRTFVAWRGDYKKLVDWTGKLKRCKQK